jgi:VIT1/CCC1 family predicted Fe2+/Mn2+ transporter
MTEADAIAHADEVLRDLSVDHSAGVVVDDHEEIGSALGAAVSSFLFFASGAIIPVLPYLFGLQGGAAVAVSSTLVGLALLGTGAVTGLLSGGPPLKRALRQLAIGFGAAGATYLLGLLFGVSAG